MTRRQGLPSLAGSLLVAVIGFALLSTSLVNPAASSRDGALGIPASRPSPPAREVGEARPDAATIVPREGSSERNRYSAAPASTSGKGEVVHLTVGSDALVPRPPAVCGT